jgi:hypothetical protein
VVVLCFVAVEGKEHALTSIITFVLTRGTGGVTVYPSGYRMEKRSRHGSGWCGRERSYRWAERYTL